MLDSDQFPPENSWGEDRERCKEAHIPDSVVYRPKSAIALEQIKRAVALGQKRTGRPAHLVPNASPSTRF